MSLRDFQSNLACLVALPGFRQRVQAQGETALDGHLDPRERARLVAAAADPGLVVTSTLVASFRLGKILQSLPLTRVLLGNRALVREAQQFWRQRPPTSFYAADEVLAFCDHLQRPRRRPVRGLSDIVALERALLELGRPRPDGETAPAQVVRFRYDAAAMLGAVTAGHRPRHLGARACAVRVERLADGSVRWTPLSTSGDEVPENANGSTRGPGASVARARLVPLFVEHVAARAAKAGDRTDGIAQVEVPRGRALVARPLRQSRLVRITRGGEAHPVAPHGVPHAFPDLAQRRAQADAEQEAQLGAVKAGETDSGRAGRRRG